MTKIIETRSTEVKGLGEAIKAARKADKRSVKELAQLAGMAPASWHAIEREKYALPLPTLRAIEQALEVDFKVEFPCES